jgi:tetratricopeptide (TPR) repeat protein
MLNRQVKLKPTMRTAPTNGNGRAKRPAIPGSFLRLLFRTAYILSAALALQVLILGSGASNAATPEEQICDVTADSALGLENYPAAIALHRKVLQSHPDNALAHYHLGFAYGMIGRGSEEVSEYLKAASLGLREWDLFLDLGLAYLDQQDYLKAVSALETSVSLGPQHPEAHFNLALAYEKAGRLNDAMKEITSSLRIAPADLDIRNTKAIICAEVGNLKCAHDEWTALLQIAPNYVPARTNLATLTGAAPISHSSFPDRAVIPQLLASESLDKPKADGIGGTTGSNFRSSSH